MKFPKVLGVNKKIKLKTGKVSNITLLNNGATTPPFKDTMNEVNNFLSTYGAFHKGAGPYAEVTYQKVCQSIKDIREFLGVKKNQSLLFTSNTSSAINLFARMLNLKKEDVVLTSDIEHTSNNLPWSYNTKTKVVYIKSLIDGGLDYKDLKKKALEYKDKIKLVTITGASNMSGYVPDIKKISKTIKPTKALLFVDGAQLAPHREINMKKQKIDALAFSAHKLYAPFGIGVLAIPTQLLKQVPVDPGGGSIDMISENNIVWASDISKHQTGTWNVAGIVATAKSCNLLKEVGWENLFSHETELIKHALDRLQKINKIKLFIEPKTFLNQKRIGTIVFNLEGYHHSLLSSVLENEYGIETRAGTICNHKLVRRWFNISGKEQVIVEKKIKQGNRLATYGVVRLSIGIYNTKSDIDRLVQALEKISKKGHVLKYKANKKEESYDVR